MLCHVVFLTFSVWNIDPITRGLKPRTGDPRHAKPQLSFGILTRLLGD